MKVALVHGEDDRNVTLDVQQNERGSRGRSGLSDHGKRVGSDRGDGTSRTGHVRVKRVGENHSYSITVR
jgi:hypothetical protein